MKRRLRLAPLPLLLLAACQQDPAPPVATAPLVSQFGSVAVVRSRTRLLGGESGGVIAAGFFGTFATPRAAPTTTPADLGTCTVTHSAPGPVLTPVPPAEFTSQDAGDALVLETAGGPYARLERASGFGRTFYSSLLGGGGAAPGPLPAGLRLQVPGAEGGFPAFADVALPDTPALDLSAPDLDRPVPADTPFTWRAAPAEAGTATVVTLELVGGGTGGTVGAQCLAADTGSFRLPQGTRDELGRAGFTAATWVRVGRTRSRLTQRGDVAVGASTAEVLTALTPGDGQPAGASR